MLPCDGFGGNPSNPHLAKNSEETFTGSEQHLQAYTVKCDQRQISFPNFIFYNFEKQMASCESTGGNVHLNGHVIGLRP